VIWSCHPMFPVLVFQQVLTNLFHCDTVILQWLVAGEWILQWFFSDTEIPQQFCCIP
jgi:hypothetical protein